MGNLAKNKGSDSKQVVLESAPVETILKDGLMRGDRALSGVTPVLTHLIASTGNSLVSDAIVARLRGMLSDIAQQLVGVDTSEDNQQDSNLVDAFSDVLSTDSAVLSHCYALAIEAQLTQRLESRAGIDPILSPLMQELIASNHASISALAMQTLAAQSRFVQAQRRMQLPMLELPAELLHAVMQRWEAFNKRRPDPVVSHSVVKLQKDFDEGISRAGLLARLVSALGGGAAATLELDHAGMALFTSGLSAKAQLPRELAIISCHQRQAARLALTLRAAGLGEAAIERQFLLIEPDERFPEGLEEISVQSAQALLKRSDASTGR